MAKPTYFLTNCALVFGWVFHRLSKIYVPLKFFTNLYAVFFYAQSNLTHLEFFIVSISTTYFHKIFTMKTVFRAF